MEIFDAPAARECLRSHPMVLVGDSVSEGVMVDLIYTLRDYSSSYAAASTRRTLSSLNGVLDPREHTLQCFPKFDSSMCYAISAKEAPLHFIRDELIGHPAAAPLAADAQSGLGKDVSRAKAKAATYLRALDALLSPNGSNSNHAEVTLEEGVQLAPQACVIQSLGDEMPAGACLNVGHGRIEMQQRRLASPHSGAAVRCATRHRGCPNPAPRLSTSPFTQDRTQDAGGRGGLSTSTHCEDGCEIFYFRLCATQ